MASNDKLDYKRPFFICSFSSSFLLFPIAVGLHPTGDFAAHRRDVASLCFRWAPRIPAPGCRQRRSELKSEGNAKRITSSNKCHATSNKCLTSSNKKLLETRS